MKKVILNAVLAAMVLSFTGCGGEAKSGMKSERPQGIKPDPRTATDAKQFDKF